MLILLALTLPASAGTTTVAMSATDTSESGVGGCTIFSDVEAAASDSVTLSVSGDQRVELQNIEILLEGHHGACEVRIDHVELFVNSTSVWSKSLSLSGSGMFDGWNLSSTEYPADVALILGSGTHTVEVVATGEAAASGERIRVTLDADFVYGTDWDSDGVDSVDVGGTDCDDDDDTIKPGATEIVGDEIDQDCDDDEICYDDADNDGYRTITTVLSVGDLSCGDSGEARADEPDGDCEDSNPAIHPGATETAGDGVDQDCDGEELCYDDADGDTYRTSSTSVSSDEDCDDAGEAYASAAAGDCDDGDGTIHPGATEIAGDEVDQDCDGQELCLTDEDNDGYSKNTTSFVRSFDDTDCQDDGEAVVTDPTDDCDDEDPDVHPGAAEVVGDEVDQDCDETEVCYADADEDGFRTAEEVASADLTCTDPGEAAASIADGDCDDADPDIRPDAEELVGDEVDQNCDAVELCYVDADDDGWRIEEVALSADLTCGDEGEARADEPGGDCDDANPEIHPEAEEIPGDGIDQDCDLQESCYRDEDGDDYTSGLTPSENLDCSGAFEKLEPTDEIDCDDSDPDIHPGATEGVGDNVDQDCSGTELCFVDADDDGYRSTDEATVEVDGTSCDVAGAADADAGTDCDDADDDPLKYPGARGWSATCEAVADNDGSRPLDEDPTAGTGCSCDSTHTSGLGFASLFLAGLALVRRRRR